MVEKEIRQRSRALQQGAEGGQTAIAEQGAGHVEDAEAGERNQGCEETGPTFVLYRGELGQGAKKQQTKTRA